MTICASFVEGKTKYLENWLKDWYPRPLPVSVFNKKWVVMRLVDGFSSATQACTWGTSLIREHPPTRTVQQVYAQSPMVVLARGWVCSYERGTPVVHIRSRATWHIKHPGSRSGLGFQVKKLETSKVFTLVFEPISVAVKQLDHPRDGACP